MQEKQRERIKFVYNIASKMPSAHFMLPSKTSKTIFYIIIFLTFCCVLVDVACCGFSSIWQQWMFRMGNWQHCMG